ncbi:hypothetical protein [Telluribacter sp.]|jgi:hypothetical protein|uniref:hypothetical protein n=1 Tax=Telluribacter sp. TaxID=1978767 RepID=UPI002E128B59|nr:hypothetical protein [Telluribacter sp.]
MQPKKARTQRNSKPEKEKISNLVAESFKNPDILKLYINGFINGHSQADMYILLMQNGAPHSVLNMSFTTAKSLHESLGALISGFEAKTNHTIMVMQDIANSALPDEETFEI